MTARSAWFLDAAPAPVPVTAWLCYDGECALCTSAAARVAPMLARRGIGTVPLQAAWVRDRVGDDLSEMAFLAADGRRFGGAEAVAQICREIGWAWPVWALSRVPGVGSAMRAAYRWIAAHRHCGGGSCRVGRPSAPTARMSAWMRMLPAFAAVGGWSC